MLQTRGWRWRVMCTAGLLAGALLLGACQSRAGRVVDSESWTAQLFPRLASPTAGQSARDAFNVYSADRRREGVDQLAAAPIGGDRVYVRMYRLLLDDPDGSVRASSAKALGLHGSAEDAARIVPLLRDASPVVRWEAAKALQKLHDPAAAGPLINVLQNDNDLDVRQASAEALGQYATPAVFHALVGALHDRDFGVARAARQSLGVLTGEDHGPEAASWLAWSRQRSGRELFSGQQLYTYEPWVAPRGRLRRMLPGGGPTVERLVPAGLETTERG